MIKWEVIEKKPPRYPRRELVVYTNDEKFHIADLYDCSDDTANTLRCAFLMLQTCKALVYQYENGGDMDAMIEQTKIVINEATNGEKNGPRPT